MVFDLSDTLMDYIPGSQQETEVIRCVTNILTGYFEGNLLVTCSRKFICFFMNKIKAPDALLALNYLDRISSMLVYEVIYRISVVRKESDLSDGELSYKFFQKTESIQPTSLICEDIYDCNFYELYTKEFMQDINVKCNRVEGGGSSVGKCIKEAKAKNAIFLSLVDSDCHYKGASIGSTAQGAINELPKNTTNIFLKILDTLEAENLIPIGYVIKHCKNQKNEKFFRQLFTNNFGFIWRYYDLKNGLCSSAIIEDEKYYQSGKEWYQKLLHKEDFETRVRNYKQAKEDKLPKIMGKNNVLLPKICKNILNQYITYLSSKESERAYIAYDKDFDKMDPLYKERKEIVDLVYAFLCVRKQEPIN